MRAASQLGFESNEYGLLTSKHPKESRTNSRNVNLGKQKSQFENTERNLGRKNERILAKEEKIKKEGWKTEEERDEKIEEADFKNGTKDMEQVYTAQDLEVVSDIVSLATQQNSTRKKQPSLFVGIFRAYDAVLHARRIDVSSDKKYYPLLLKLSLVSGETWSEKLENMMRDLSMKVPAGTYISNVPTKYPTAVSKTARSSPVFTGRTTSMPSSTPKRALSTTPSRLHKPPHLQPLLTTLQPVSRQVQDIPPSNVESNIPNQLLKENQSLARPIIPNPEIDLLKKCFAAWRSYSKESSTDRQLLRASKFHQRNVQKHVFLQWWNKLNFQSSIQFKSAIRYSKNLELLYFKKWYRKFEQKDSHKRQLYNVQRRLITQDERKIIKTDIAKDQGQKDKMENMAERFILVKTWKMWRCRLRNEPEEWRRSQVLRRSFFLWKKKYRAAQYYRQQTIGKGHHSFFHWRKLMINRQIADTFYDKLIKEKLRNMIVHWAEITPTEMEQRESILAQFLVQTQRAHKSQIFHKWQVEANGRLISNEKTMAILSNFFKIWTTKYKNLAIADADLSRYWSINLYYSRWSRRFQKNRRTRHKENVVNLAKEYQMRITQRFYKVWKRNMEARQAANDFFTRKSQIVTQDYFHRWMSRLSHLEKQAQDADMHRKYQLLNSSMNRLDYQFQILRKERAKATRFREIIQKVHFHRIIDRWHGLARQSKELSEYRLLFENTLNERLCEQALGTWKGMMKEKRLIPLERRVARNRNLNILRKSMQIWQNLCPIFEAVWRSNRSIQSKFLILWRKQLDHRLQTQLAVYFYDSRIQEMMMREWLLRYRQRFNLLEWQGNYDLSTLSLQKICFAKWKLILQETKERNALVSQHQGRTHAQILRNAWDAWSLLSSDHKRQEMLSDQARINFLQRIYFKAWESKCRKQEEESYYLAKEHANLQTMRKVMDAWVDMVVQNRKMEQTAVAFYTYRLVRDAVDRWAEKFVDVKETCHTLAATWVLRSNKHILQKSWVKWKRQLQDRRNADLFYAQVKKRILITIFKNHDPITDSTLGLVTKQQDENIDYLTDQYLLSCAFIAWKIQIDQTESLQDKANEFIQNTRLKRYFQIWRYRVVSTYESQRRNVVLSQKKAQLAEVAASFMEYRNLEMTKRLFERWRDIHVTLAETRDEAMTKRMVFSAWHRWVVLSKQAEKTLSSTAFATWRLRLDEMQEMNKQAIVIYSQNLIAEAVLVWRCRFLDRQQRQYSAFRNKLALQFLLRRMGARAFQKWKGKCPKSIFEKRLVDRNEYDQSIDGEYLRMMDKGTRFERYRLLGITWTRWRERFIEKAFDRERKLIYADTYAKKAAKKKALIAWKLYGQMTNCGEITPRTGPSGRGLLPEVEHDWWSNRRDQNLFEDQSVSTNNLPSGQSSANSAHNTQNSPRNETPALIQPSLALYGDISEFASPYRRPLDVLELF